MNAKKQPSDIQREQAAIVLTHLGKAARLVSKMSQEAFSKKDEPGGGYFNRLYWSIENQYIDLKRMFPDLEENK